MEKIFIQQEANRILSESGCAGIFPAPVEKIAKYLGFSCYYFKPDTSTIDISGAVNQKNKRIYINPNEPLKRQQFTVAHEIGHIILHPQIEDHIDYRTTAGNSADPNKESESNYFAANMLMPLDMFIYQWNKCNKDLALLSDFFGVTPSAIAVRATSLKLD